MIATAPPNLGGGGLETKDYRIETDETHWNFNTGDFTMPHRVRVLPSGYRCDRRPGPRELEARHGDLDRATSWCTTTATRPKPRRSRYSGNGPATLTCDQLDDRLETERSTPPPDTCTSRKARAPDTRGSRHRSTAATARCTSQGHVKLTDAEQSMTAEDLALQPQHQRRRRSRRADHHQAAGRSPKPGARDAEAEETQAPVLRRHEEVACHQAVEDFRLRSRQEAMP